MSNHSDRELIALAAQHLQLPLSPAQRRWCAQVAAHDAGARLTPQERLMMLWVCELWAEEVRL